VTPAQLFRILSGPTRRPAPTPASLRAAAVGLISFSVAAVLFAAEMGWL